MTHPILTARRARVRDLIVSAGSRFASVEFTKKNGDLRVMQVQPATGKLRVKGEAGSPSGRQAAETRAERHPHLFPIWDAGKRDFRSINLDTVHAVQVDGIRFEIAAVG